MNKKLFYLYLLVFLLISALICNTTDEPPLATNLNEDTADNWLYQSGRVGIWAEKRLTNSPLSFQLLHIIIDHQLLWSDTTHIFITRNGILPIVREITNNDLEIMLGFLESSKNPKIIRLIYSHAKGGFTQDTLPLFIGNHKDIDFDGEIEFMGYLENWNPYCAQCDSTYYNPLLIYKMTANGFQLDTSATKDWIEKHYRAFFGFKPNKKIILPFWKPDAHLDV